MIRKPGGWFGGFRAYLDRLRGAWVDSRVADPAARPGTWNRATNHSDRDAMPQAPPGGHPPLQVQVEQAPDDSDTCVVVVNRAVSSQGAQYFGQSDDTTRSPLARALLDLGGLDAVLLQENTVTLLKPLGGRSWASLRDEVERRVRAHFETLDAALASSEEPMSAADEELLARVRSVLDRDINPHVASHGGKIQAVGVRGNTLTIHMQGGCQGCGMAAVTLRQGVEASLRRHVPEIEVILDATDHASGASPYY